MNASIAMNRRHRAALGCVAVALALAGCSDSKTHTPTPLTDIAHPALGIDEAWSDSVGNGSGDLYTDLRIALTDDAMYLAAVNGLVEALNPDSGKLLWKTRTKARLISGPGLDGKHVLVGTLDAQAIALQTGDGKELWRANASSEVGATPVGSGGTDVVRSVDGRVYGVDANSGARTWNFDRLEPNLTLRGMSAPLIASGKVFIGLDNGQLVALGLGDGQLAWEQAISVPSGGGDLDRLVDIDADLLMADEGLFVVTYGSDLALVDPVTGQSIWRRTVKSYTGMAYGGSKLFVSDADGNMLAFDASSGTQVWKQEALKYRQLSPPVFDNGYVVVGDFRGYLHWLSPEDGRIVARTRFGSDPITAAPVAGPKYLYVMNTDGDVGAFSTHERAKK